MKKNTRKFFLLGIFVFLFLLFLFLVFREGGLLFPKRRKTVQADSAQIEANKPYQVSTEEIPYEAKGEAAWEMNAILSLCRYESGSTEGEAEIKTYRSDALKDYLPLCSQIIEISMINQMLFIDYETTDNCQVSLCYGEEGLDNRVVYHASSDTAYEENQEGAFIHINFRYGK